MRPTIDMRLLSKAPPREYLVRFAFGGAVSAATGAITMAFGPEIGGLFLAFPAILPASLTLVAKHDGREQAAEDARGAVLGSGGLVAFALVVDMLAERWTPAVMLVAATCAWATTCLLLWTLVLGSRAGRR